ncbi:MAG: recombinase family protein [Streptosporangiaceae bacterium]
MGWIRDPSFLAITLAATSPGLVVPVLKDAGQSETVLGQLTIAGATAGGFGAITLLSLLFSATKGGTASANEAHDMIMSTFGSLSKGERNRIKIRVRAAMSAQAQTGGRYLGGRPPYGYKLIDAGPHPNPAKVADGKRLCVLARDEPAAIVVERIFAEFLVGFGIFAIAERLTRDGIDCPSAHDRARNRHRCGLAWSKSAVRAILANPRARAYLVTDQAVADTASRYADCRPSLDPVSAAALGASAGQGPAGPDDGQARPDGKGWRRGKRHHADPEALLRDALRSAPEDGVSVADLMRVTGMGRSWVYYRLADLAAAGLAIQTTRGCWRATPQEGSHA